MRRRDVQRFKLYGQRTLVVLALSGITFLFLRGAVRMYDRYAEASDARAAAVAEAQALRDREADLSEKIASLSSDRGIEEELRRRYGVAREGEGVIEVVDTPPPPAVESRSGGFLGWLRDIF